MIGQVKCMQSFQDYHVCICWYASFLC